MESGLQINSEPLDSTDRFYDEVASTFWMVFFFYIVASVGWIMYCCISKNWKKWRTRSRKMELLDSWNYNDYSTPTIEQPSTAWKLYNRIPILVPNSSSSPISPSLTLIDSNKNGLDSIPPSTSTSFSSRKMSRLLLILVFLTALLSVFGFEKFALSKDKNVRANLKHPISRRVLRYERSINFADFPLPEEIPQYIPTVDFAKIRPEFPSKTKHSQFADADYLPEMDF